MGVNHFNRDPRDTQFILHEHLGMAKLLAYEPFADFSVEHIDQVMAQAHEVATQCLGPAMQDGDREGCQFKAGEVKVPPAFHDCWRTLRQGGWLAMANDRRWGGRGLPAVVSGLANEYFFGANMALNMYPLLTSGNARLIEAFGTEADRELFAPRMYSGQWAGTMCLTEPLAGSDVGWLETSATPDPDSPDQRVYKIKGRKRFISAGNHDLTENIIHLLLARIEGAPHGTKGISLFIVPKIWVEPDGALGRPNDVVCTGIEHKMGIHGSATCALHFGGADQCRGILLGEPNTGMAKMFQMMNEARVGTGLMGLALSASAYDAARVWAKRRVQGPPFTDRRGQRVKIINHEDVRRMLLHMKAGTEAMRALIAKTYYLMDVARFEPDAAARQKAAGLVELYTPLVKAYCTDFGFSLTREALQVFGGAGYCNGFPAEQYVRDCKILSIWEGTNYIQSLDLVGRKLGLEGGAVFQGALADIQKFCADNAGDADFGKCFSLLSRAVGVVGFMAGGFLNYLGDGRIGFIPLNATAFLECLAEVVMASLSLEQALIARRKLATVDPASADGLFYQGKTHGARFFCQRVLPATFARQIAFEQEDASALEIPEACF